MGKEASPVDDPGFIRDLIAAGAGEESITQFLAALLRDSGILAAYLGEISPELANLDLGGAIVRAEDEEAAERGRPDVSITVGEQLMMLVENKLAAALTENQPHEYLKALALWKNQHPAGTAVLVIHAPEGRMLFLRKETWQRLATRTAGLVRQGDSCGGVLVRCASWSVVEHALAGHLPRVVDPVVNYLLRSFLALLAPAAEAVSHPITKDHVMHLRDRTVLEAFAAAEDVLGDVQSLLSDRNKSKVECGLDGPGIAFTPRTADGGSDTEKEFYVGLYSRVGARFGVSPFLLQLTGDDYVGMDAVRESGRRVVEGSELEIFGWVSRPAVPIELQPDLDPPLQAESVVNEIEAIRKLALGL